MKELYLDLIVKRSFNVLFSVQCGSIATIYRKFLRAYFLKTLMLSN